MKKWIWLLAVFALGLSGCTNLFALPPVSASLGQPFTLGIGQSAKFDDGLVIAFENVPTDERCSSCTASFYAQVNLRFTAPGKSPVLISLTTPPNFKVTGDTASYTIQFIKLTPQPYYPHSPVLQQDYQLTLKVIPSY